MGTVQTTVQTPSHDPLMATFDRGVALAAYALLFAAPFGLGLPALVALVLAFAHRDDPVSLTRSHYRFQIRVFWTTVVCLVIGTALAVGAGGLALGSALHAIGDRAIEGGWLLFAGMAFLAGGFVYLLAASIYGFIKLLAGRPIRHRNA